MHTGPLGPALTAHDLRAIADAVDQIAKVPARVSEVTVGQHRITLERHSDQMDGDSYTVTGIERTEAGR